MGVLVWEKRKSDHVTSLIHPLDHVVFSAGQKRGRAGTGLSHNSASVSR